MPQGRNGACIGAKASLHVSMCSCRQVSQQFIAVPCVASTFFARHHSADTIQERRGGGVLRRRQCPRAPAVAGADEGTGPGLPPPPPLLAGVRRDPLPPHPLAAGSRPPGPPG